MTETHEITFERGNIDPTTGAQWVYVPRHVAHGHRLGRVGGLMWGAILYYLSVALFSAAALMGYYGIENFFGVLIHGALVILAVLILLGFAIRGQATIMFAAVHFAASVALALTGPFTGVLAGGMSFLVMFYLLDSDRANLTFRHRYRSWTVDNSAGRAPAQTHNAGES
ncbi:MAG: hypothetical protein ACPGUX_04475 [Halocynthiibacter sp.]